MEQRTEMHASAIMALAADSAIAMAMTIADTDAALTEAAFRNIELLTRTAITELGFFLPGDHAREEELAQKAIDRMLEAAGHIPDRGGY